MPGGPFDRGEYRIVNKKRHDNGEQQQDQSAPGQESPAQQSEGNMGEAGTSTADLEAALQEAQQKAAEYWDQLLHAQADLTNMQRRAERELANAHKYALDRFVRELLPVHDSLELGLKAASEPDSDPDKIREGLELTLRMFIEVLEKFGVKIIDPQGEAFDPSLHEAMTTQQAPDLPANTVVNVFQKGALLNDRLVRPASVIVSVGGEKQAPPESHESVDEHA